ncbi:MAG: PP2C family serine/threonine-protein phosphatase [Bacillota bacterium]
MAGSINKVEGTSQWIVTGSSIRGANHLRRELPNQDAIDWAVHEDNLVLALSDGHGSIKHFRSDIGAKLAVESAIEIILKEISTESLSTSVLKKLETRIKNKLPQRITNQWLSKVKKHYQNNLFSLDRRAQMKLEQIELEKGITARKKVEQNYVKAYGSTLVVVVLTEKFSLYLQLGDGDIVVLSDTAKHRPFKGKETGGPATDSLCMSQPSNHFKFSLVPCTRGGPLLIMLSTDGYINSFRNSSDYLQAIDDFASLAVESGIEYIANNLTEWLIETSQHGSGDDITLGLIFHRDLLTEN